MQKVRPLWFATRGPILGALAAGLASLGLSLSGLPAQQNAASPTFYRDVLPILEQHCQSCHRAGSIAPMPFESYAQTRPFAAAIQSAAEQKTMPPWFADPAIGKFADDPSLIAAEIATLAAWSKAGAPAGDPRDAPPPRHWAEGWSIAEPDLAISMPQAVSLPASGDVPYTYEIVPTHFAEDRWVQMSEVLPRRRGNVHHAVVYVRPPDSGWLRHAPVGVPFTAASLLDPEDRRDARWTDSDILLVYAPGSSPDQWPADMAKLIPAGSDLVFQMHYTTNGHPGSDQTSIGLVFSRHAPSERVLTLQLTNDHFLIPPGEADFRVEAHGTLPNDATLLGFMPHMHLRGKRFEYNIIHWSKDFSGKPIYEIEPLLRVHYHFHWQMSYRLAHPRFLKAGTELQAVGWYDNSRANPHNPDPSVAVSWGEQTYEEMMVGFFDVAAPAAMDKQRFFLRSTSSPASGSVSPVREYRSHAKGPGNEVPTRYLQFDHQAASPFRSPRLAVLHSKFEARPSDATVLTQTPIDPRRTMHHQKVPRVEVYWTTVTYKTVILYSLLGLGVVFGGIYFAKPELYTALINKISKTVGNPDIDPVNADQKHARFVNLDGRVQIKKFNSVQWVDATLSTSLDKGDLVQTGSDGDARITFADGTNYTIKPDSLITVEENSTESNRPSSVSVSIQTGAVDLATPYLRSPDSKAAVKSEDATTQLHSNSSAAVKFDPEKKESEVVVSSGSAEVQRGEERIDLVQHEKATIPSTGAIQRSMVLAPPDLVQPLNLAPIIAENPKTATVRFEWKAVPEAVSYRLRVSTTTMFTRTVVDKTNIAGTSLDVTGLDAGDYFWNVMATDAKKQSSELGDIWRFSLVAQGKSQDMVLEITGYQLHGRVAEVIGKTEPGAALIVNGQPVPNIAADGTFRHFTEPLEPGQHTIVVVGQNRRGGTGHAQVSIVVPK